MKTPFIVLILIAFIFNSFGPLPVSADELRLPTPGVMIHLSPPENPPVFKGVIVYPNNPFKFNFILDVGNGSKPTLQKESSKLVKYFLAAITTPENDLWVNLSPYEKNRIIPQSFGQTDMGRDLLAEDYILKQITASLIYPEDEIGKKFWKRIYEEAQKKYGTTNIPVNTFNKVWIVPDHAKVYEHGNTAYIVKATLKVMLEQDYLSLQKHSATLPSVFRNDTSAIGANIVREIVIPELNKEINEGKSFATLRQAYYSLILATWFKKRMKDSLLGRKYMDQNKINNLSSPNAFIGDPEAIYQRYLKAFKKGVFNYIKEEANPMTQAMIPRKYFSGGWVGSFSAAQIAYSEDLSTSEKADLPNDDAQLIVNLGNAQPAKPNFAMGSKEIEAIKSSNKRILDVKQTAEFPASRITARNIANSVDEPLIPVAMEFIRMGIQPVASSAHGTNVRDPYEFIKTYPDLQEAGLGFNAPSGYLSISYDNLSKGNKERIDRILISKKVQPWKGIYLFKNTYEYPGTEEKATFIMGIIPMIHGQQTTVGEVASKAVVMARIFTSQRLRDIPGKLLRKLIAKNSNSAMRAVVNEILNMNDNSIEAKIMYTNSMGENTERIAQLLLIEKYRPEERAYKGQNGLTYWIDTKRGDIDEIIEQNKLVATDETRPSQDEAYKFDIKMDGHKIGRIEYSVNFAERKSVMGFVTINGNDQRKGLASIGLALLKVFIIKNKYEDYIMQSDHVFANPDAEGSRRAMAANFESVEPNPSPPSHVNTIIWRVNANDPVKELVRNFHPPTINQAPPTVEERLRGLLGDRLNGVEQETFRFDNKIPDHQFYYFYNPGFDRAGDKLWIDEKAEFYKRINDWLEQVERIQINYRKNGEEKGRTLNAVLREVLENAFDSIASRYDGSIAARPKVPQRSANFNGEIRIKLEIKDGNLIIVVLDNGLGQYAADTSHKSEFYYTYTGGHGVGLEGGTVGGRRIDGLKDIAKGSGGDFQLQLAYEPGQNPIRQTTEAKISIPLSSLALSASPAMNTVEERISTFSNNLPGLEQRINQFFGEIQNSPVFDPANADDRAVWQKRKAAFREIMHSSLKPLEGIQLAYKESEIEPDRLLTSLSEILENSYDAIVSRYDGNIFRKLPNDLNRPTGFRGQIRIKLEIKEGNLNIHLFDNGLGHYSAENIDKKQRSSFYMGYGNWGRGLISEAANGSGGSFFLNMAYENPRQNSIEQLTEARLSIPLASMALTINPAMNVVLHKVQMAKASGDMGTNLERIAKHYGVSAVSIARYNTLVTIPFMGQELRIPLDNHQEAPIDVAGEVRNSVKLRRVAPDEYWRFLVAVSSATEGMTKVKVTLLQHVNHTFFGLNDTKGIFLGLDVSKKDNPFVVRYTKSQIYDLEYLISEKTFQPLLTPEIESSYVSFIKWIKDRGVQTDSAMLKNEPKIQSGPGGIDLTAKRMNLEVDSDKAMVGQAMDVKALENIEIKGLYIKDIEIKPLKNLLQVLGVSSS